MNNWKLKIFKVKVQLEDGVYSNLFYIETIEGFRYWKY